MEPGQGPLVTPGRSIRRLLVANRAEIAQRVIRTARRMGIQTVAVHSEADALAPFVADATFAVPLGGRSATQSYLDADKVLRAAARVGADAIHPGYGFLSESPEFAERVVGAGLVWVGPTPAAMRAMALKVQAKRLVAAAGVPLVPGAELAGDATAAQIREAAQQVGLPLLVKASAGGGGKGMRLVTDIGELAEAVAAASREAASAFGDPTVFLERYVQRSRHVEVQVFGDAHGNLVHLFERECSIQRRHQKIIEESPSPGATRDTLVGMYAAAVATARAIGYQGAGTVEFLVAGQGDEQRFYFLEMNTRLQVEHPVTEAVTGLDLVEWQLRVARGEPLPLGQDQIRRHGHAIEARLYAEDPGREYLPNTGRVERFDCPGWPDVRVDAGVQAGTEVTALYDPLLAKLIGTGVHREAAASDLASCLAQLEIAGVRTNRESLAAILRSPAFLAGDTTTAFLAEHPDVLAPAVPADELAVLLAAAALGLAHLEAQGAPWGALAPLGWQNVRAVPAVRRFRVNQSGRELTIAVGVTRQRVGATVDLRTDDGHVGERGTQAARPEPRRPADRSVPGSTAVGAACVEVTGERFAHGTLSAQFDGVRTHHRVVRAGQWLIVTGPGRTIELLCLPRFEQAAGAGHDHGPATPVPGTITRVLVSVGDRVSVGDTLVVLEAMKMEHRVRADLDGVVTEIRVRAGDSVQAHQVVLVLADQ